MWLIRSSNNKILGPISLDDLKKKILDGRVAADDEFCEQNNYWFSIQEVNEVKKFLNIEPEKLADLFRMVQDGDGTEPEMTRKTEHDTAKLERAALQSMSKGGSTAVSNSKGEMGEQRGPKRFFGRENLLNFLLLAGLVSAGLVIRILLKILRQD